MSKKRMFYSSDRAIRLLGYQARPAREAISDAIAWFREKGYFLEPAQESPINKDS
jgi:dihydroflavonol-4-reductase